MSVEIICGVSGAGKTRYVQELAKKEGNNKNIVVFTRFNDWDDFAEKSGWNVVQIKERMKENLFEFDPGPEKIGKLYELRYTTLINDLCTLILILLKDHSSRCENKIRSAIKEMYSAFNITEKEYKTSHNPGIFSQVDTFGLLIDILKKNEKELAEQLNQHCSLFKKENPLISTFKKKSADFSLNDSHNVLNLYTTKSLYGGYNSAVVYSYLMVAKNIFMNSKKPFLFIIDDIEENVLKEWWITEFILDLNEFYEETEIKIVTQSISNTNTAIPMVINKADQFVLFRQSYTSLAELKNHFPLRSEKDPMLKAFNLGRGETLVLNKKSIKATVKRGEGKLDKQADTFIWNMKMVYFRTVYQNMGYYERMCRSAGYTKSCIEELVAQRIKNGGIEKNDIHGREAVCEDEIKYWS